MNSPRPLDWRKGWAVFAVLLALWGIATIEPETAEAVNKAITLGAMGCVFWAVWHLMQHDR